MIMSRADESVVRRLVGGATVERGRGYALAGAVVSREWNESGWLVGDVQGGAAEPYHVEIRLIRGGQAFEAFCDCPVGYNCKHAVAVLLAPDPRPRRPDLRVVGPAPAARTPAWEKQLRLLLADGDPDGEAPAELGLQFELVAARTRPGKRAADEPGIRLRPVVRGASGRWVRGNVGWSRLDHLGYGTANSARLRHDIALLKELRALHGLWVPPYPYHDDVWLESVGSRRLWGLLGDAEQAGMPLLCAGRGDLPVQLAATPVEAAVDVTRHGDELRVRPRLVAGPDEVAEGRMVWIGSPAHGLAWWQGDLDGNVTPELHIGPLSRPLDPRLADLLHHGPLTVPAADVERFQREMAPALRRRVMLRSSDGSVELPEVAPDELLLQLVAGDGPCVELAWAIAGGGGGPRPLSERPDEAAARAAAAAAKVLAAHPTLVEPSPWGWRLLPGGRLGGLEAVRFVTDTLPALGAVGALRVEWQGEPPAFREVTDAPLVRIGGEESGGGDWFDLTVEVEVGGEEVPFHALFVALAQGESHLLLPSGTYFSLDRPELRQLAELISEARSLHDAPRGTVRLGRFQASLWEELQALAVVSAQAGAWTDAVAALASAGDDGQRPLPAGLTADLRPYQETGFQWLASRYDHRLGGLLADDMGLGKTLQALALVCHAREAAEGLPAPWLVVAPTSVVGTWVSEAARFAPGLPVAAVTETGRRRGAPLADAVAGAGLVVTSYTLFRLEYDEYEAIRWAGLLLDEAQFAKNPASHNYQRARRLPVPFKLAMTGTPLENSLTELWALTSITAPGLFARPDRFSETYRLPIERHGDQTRLDQLRRRIRPVLLRRTKDQVAADLPDKQEQVLELDLHPRHRRLYQTWLQRERQKILGLLDDMDGNRFEIFRSLTLLRQAALDVALVDPDHAGVPSTKLDALSEMLEDVVADGHRVLVFSQFTRFLNAARRRIEAAGIECCYLDGSTRRRSVVIDGFRNGSAPVFLISLKAGGFGLNLTEADYCILLDPWWNPATEAQAVDRAHRIGQTRKVMVYRLVASDTIEEKVMALKARKAALFNSVVGGGGFESGALTAADVRALLA